MHAYKISFTSDADFSTAMRASSVILGMVRRGEASIPLGGDHTFLLAVVTAGPEKGNAESVTVTSEEGPEDFVPSFAGWARRGVSCEEVPMLDSYMVQSQNADLAPHRVAPQRTLREDARPEYARIAENREDEDRSGYMANQRLDDAVFASSSRAKPELKPVGRGVVGSGSPKSRVKRTFREEGVEGEGLKAFTRRISQLTDHPRYEDALAVLGKGS